MSSQYSAYFYEPFQKDNSILDILEIAQNISNKRIWVWQYFDNNTIHNVPNLYYRKQDCIKSAQEYISVFSDIYPARITYPNPKLADDWFVWEFEDKEGNYWFSIHFTRLNIR